MYFGGNTSFEQAARTTFAQFKYSIANKDKDFRAANAHKTLEKFGRTYREYKEQFGAQVVQDKLDFQLVTNQPISKSLLEAIEALATNTPCKGDVGTQAKRFREASCLSGKSLAGFAGKFKLLGRTGSLPETKNELASLPAKEAARVHTADASPYPRLKKKLRKNGGFYSGRPNTAPKPSFEFHLDYDFHKLDVDNLACVFGQPCWKVADLMSEIVRAIDPTVESMHYATTRSRSYGRGITTGYHTYGQQLGWHGLFLAAGKLLKDHPVTDDWWYEADPWREWFGRYGLTRDDGLWLSDGTDRTPLDTAEFLLERKKEELAITGDPEILLSLIGVRPRVAMELIIEGQWFSADNVEVNISSALVPPQKAATLARQLAHEEPMTAWVPTLNESEEDSEYVRGDKKEYTPS